MIEITIYGKGIQFNPVCGIFAIHYITRKPIEHCFESYKEKFKVRKGWKGYTYFYKLVNLLESFDVEYKEIKKPKYKLRDFHENNEHSKLYLVRIPGHFIVISNNTVYDNYNPHGVLLSDYKRKNSKVTHIVEIV